MTAIDRGCVKTQAAEIFAQRSAWESLARRRNRKLEPETPASKAKLCARFRLACVFTQPESDAEASLVGPAGLTFPRGSSLNFAPRTNNDTNSRSILVGPFH